MYIIRLINYSLMEGGAGLFLVLAKLKNEIKNTINHSSITSNSNENSKPS